MISPLPTGLDVKESGGITPAARLIHERSLIVRLVGRLPVDRHLVFHARAVAAHALLSLDPAVVHLAGRGTEVCPVRLDFAVCPLCLSIIELVVGSVALPTRPF